MLSALREMDAYTLIKAVYYDAKKRAEASTDLKKLKIIFILIIHLSLIVLKLSPKFLKILKYKVISS